MMTVSVNSESFEAFVTDHAVALVDFSADWCGPCRVMKPLLADVAREYAQRAAIAVVDVDEEPELTAAFRISAVPTLVFFKNGEAVGAVQGAVERHVLTEQLDKMLRQ